MQRYSSKTNDDNNNNNESNNHNNSNNNKRKEDDKNNINAYSQLNQLVKEGNKHKDNKNYEGAKIKYSKIRSIIKDIIKSNIKDDLKIFNFNFNRYINGKSNENEENNKYNVFSYRQSKKCIEIWNKKYTNEVIEKLENKDEKEKIKSVCKLIVMTTSLWKELSIFEFIVQVNLIEIFCINNKNQIILNKINEIRNMMNENSCFYITYNDLDHKNLYELSGSFQPINRETLNNFEIEILNKIKNQKQNVNNISSNDKNKELNSENVVNKESKKKLKNKITKYKEKNKYIKIKKISSCENKKNDLEIFSQPILELDDKGNLSRQSVKDIMDELKIEPTSELILKEEEINSAIENLEKEKNKTDENTTKIILLHLLALSFNINNKKYDIYFEKYAKIDTRLYNSEQKFVQENNIIVIKFLLKKDKIKKIKNSFNNLNVEIDKKLTFINSNNNNETPKIKKVVESNAKTCNVFFQLKSSRSKIIGMKKKITEKEKNLEKLKKEINYLIDENNILKKKCIILKNEIIEHHELINSAKNDKSNDVVNKFKKLTEENKEVNEKNKINEDIKSEELFLKKAKLKNENKTLRTEEATLNQEMQKIIKKKEYNEKLNKRNKEKELENNDEYNIFSILEKSFQFKKDAITIFKNEIKQKKCNFMLIKSKYAIIRKNVEMLIKNVLEGKQDGKYAENIIEELFNYIIKIQNDLNNALKKENDKDVLEILNNDAKYLFVITLSLDGIIGSLVNLSLRENGTIDINNFYNGIEKVNSLYTVITDINIKIFERFFIKKVKKNISAEESNFLDILFISISFLGKLRIDPSKNYKNKLDEKEKIKIKKIFEFNKNKQNLNEEIINKILMPLFDADKVINGYAVNIINNISAQFLTVLIYDFDEENETREIIVKFLNKFKEKISQTINNTQFKQDKYNIEILLNLQEILKLIDGNYEIKARKDKEIRETLQIECNILKIQNDFLCYLKLTQEDKGNDYRNIVDQIKIMSLEMKSIKCKIKENQKMFPSDIHSLATRLVTLKYIINYANNLQPKSNQDNESNDKINALKSPLELQEEVVDLIEKIYEKQLYDDNLNEIDNLLIIFYYIKKYIKNNDSKINSYLKNILKDYDCKEEGVIKNNNDSKNLSVQNNDNNTYNLNIMQDNIIDVLSEEAKKMHKMHQEHQKTFDVFSIINKIKTNIDFMLLNENESNRKKCASKILEDLLNYIEEQDKKFIQFSEKDIEYNEFIKQFDDVIIYFYIITISIEPIAEKLAPVLLLNQNEKMGDKEKPNEEVKKITNFYLNSIAGVFNLIYFLKTFAKQANSYEQAKTLLTISELLNGIAFSLRYMKLPNNSKNATDTILFTLKIKFIHEVLKQISEQTSRNYNVIPENMVVLLHELTLKLADVVEVDAEYSQKKITEEVGNLTISLQIFYSIIKDNINTKYNDYNNENRILLSNIVGQLKNYLLYSSSVNECENISNEDNFKDESFDKIDENKNYKKTINDVVEHFIQSIVIPETKTSDIVTDITGDDLPDCVNKGKQELELELELELEQEQERELELKLKPENIISKASEQQQNHKLSNQIGTTKLTNKLTKPAIKFFDAYSNTTQEKNSINQQQTPPQSNNQVPLPSNENYTTTSTTTTTTQQPQQPPVLPSDTPFSELSKCSNVNNGGIFLIYGDDTYKKNPYYFYALDNPENKHEENQKKQQNNENQLK